MLCAVAAMAMTSCGSNVDSKIDRLEEIAKEAQALQESGDIEKALKLGQEAMEIGQDLAKQADKLTPEQQERLMNIGGL